MSRYGQIAVITSLASGVNNVNPNFCTDCPHPHSNRSIDSKIFAAS